MKSDIELWNMSYTELNEEIRRATNELEDYVRKINDMQNFKNSFEDFCKYGLIECMSEVEYNKFKKLKDVIDNEINK